MLPFLYLPSALTMTLKFIMVNREAIRLHELQKPITVHLVTTAACDTLITLAMITIVSSFCWLSSLNLAYLASMLALAL